LGEDVGNLKYGTGRLEPDGCTRRLALKGWNWNVGTHRFELKVGT